MQKLITFFLRGRPGVADRCYLRQAVLVEKTNKVGWRVLVMIGLLGLSYANTQEGNIIFVAWII